MHIAEIAVFSLDLPIARGSYTMSGGRTLTFTRSTVVRLRTDTGLVGFGEAATAGTAYMDSFAESVQAALRELAPTIVGLDPMQPAVLNAHMDSALRGHAPAKAAIDIACWDLRGQRLGLAAYELLGGRFANAVPVFDAISLGSPDQMAEYARSMRAAGIRRYQLKLGDDPGIDAARLRAVADAAGDWDFMTCDANGGWTLGQAARMVRAVADFDVYVEQPCATLENVASLRARTKLPVVVDESITGPTDLVDAVRLRACDAVNLKASRLGGLTKAALVRDLAVSLGLQVIVDEAGGGDIVQSAMVHLAASTPPRALLGTSATTGFSLHVAGSTAPATIDGWVRPRETPGLGIEVDDAALGRPLYVHANVR